MSDVDTSSSSEDSSTSSEASSTSSEASSTSRESTPATVNLPMRVRYHSPSHEEKNQSLQLIEQWKQQIADMNKEIKEAEKVQRGKEFELDAQLQAEITALRKEYQAKRDALAEETVKGTQEIRERLQATQKRLDNEQAFLSTVRRLSSEVLVEIFKWCVGEKPPSRQLAQVCKAWKALILNTPSLWRNVKAHILHYYQREQQIQAFRRRIELSKSAVLDVTLSFTSYYGGKDEALELFKILAETGTDRWYSLTFIVQMSTKLVESTICSLYKGPFTRLHELSIFGFSDDDGGEGEDLFPPFMRSILQSRTVLTRLEFRFPVPSLLSEPRIFSHVTVLHVAGSIVGHLPPLPHLQELNLITLPSDDDSIASLSPLPKFTQLERPVHFEHLQKMQRQKVEVLKIAKIYVSQDNPDTPTAMSLDFPKLLSLEITRDGFASLKYIRAPKLTKLSLYRGNYQEKERKQNNQMVIDLFQNVPAESFLSIQPITLSIGLSLSATAIMAVLKHWSQIEFLTLEFGKEFTWTGNFASALTRKKDPLCPALWSLRLHSSIRERYGDKSWRETARKIVEVRRDIRIESSKNGVDWEGLDSDHPQDAAIEKRWRWA